MEVTWIESEGKASLRVVVVYTRAISFPFFIMGEENIQPSSQGPEEKHLLEHWVDSWQNLVGKGSSLNDWGFMVQLYMGKENWAKQNVSPHTWTCRGCLFECTENAYLVHKIDIRCEELGVSLHQIVWNLLRMLMATLEFWWGVLWPLCCFQTTRTSPVCRVVSWN